MCVQCKLWGGLIILLFELLHSPDCISQDEASIRKMLKTGDQKKLNKDDKIRMEADAIIAEVNGIYAEMRTMQQDSALQEKNIRSKKRLMEKQSWQKQVEASALYEKGNDRTYSIYKKYLSRFWKEHEGEESNFLNAKMHEEQARDNHAQAGLFRRNARHMNLGLPKVEKLMEANNLESAAIRKQLSSLGLCFEIPEPQIVTADTILTAPDSAVITAPVTDTVRMAETQVTAMEEVKPEPAAEPIVVVPVVPLEMEDENPAFQEKVTGNTDQIVFRIQVAASRTPFSFEDLAKISPANLPVEVVSEGGWLKFQYIGVPLYADAQRIFREANVKGSFIVSYRNGVRQNLPEMIAISRELEKRIMVEGRSGLIAETLYHLEIAVSKVALKAAEVAKLYNGPEPVLLIMDQGLYRYQLNAGYSPDDARVLKQKTGLPGARIVAYKNARLMEMDAYR